MHDIAQKQGTCPKSPTISEDKYDQIVHHLQHPDEKVDAHFKAWVKGRKFQLMDLPGLGLQQTSFDFPN